MGIRSFLAFELPSEMKTILARTSENMRSSPLDVRWVKVENIHLTLVFMGNVPEERLEPIGEQVADICREHGPFRVALKGIGLFSGRRNPRVLWAGLQGDIERMALFRDNLQMKLEPFGIRPEHRRFKPHLTMGRFRKGARSSKHLDDMLTKYESLHSPDCELVEFVLFRSDLRPGGARYTRMRAWPLTGSR